MITIYKLNLPDDLAILELQWNGSEIEEKILHPDGQTFFKNLQLTGVVNTQNTNIPFAHSEDFLKAVLQFGKSTYFYPKQN